MPSVRGSKRSLPVEISDDEGGTIVKRPARAETIGSIPNPEPTSGDTRVRDSKATANVLVPLRVPVLEIPDSQDEGDDDSEDGERVYDSEGHPDTEDKLLPMEDVPEELDVTGIVAEEGEVADPSAYDRLERFRARLQHILYGLIDAAQAIPNNSNFSVDLSDGVLPMGRPHRRSLQFFGSTDAKKAQLVESLFTATPLRTKLVLGQLGWTCEDLLSLPQFELTETRPGVYIDVVTGPTAYDAYVGSATSAVKENGRGGLGARRLRHEKDIRNGEKKPSAHHRQLLQQGWCSNFRLLVGFPLGTAYDYSIVFESAMIILLDTHKYLGYYSKFAPPSTFDLIKQVRSTTIFPTTEYRGLNRALPVRQGWERGPKVESCAHCHLSRKDIPEQASGLGDPTKPNKRENHFRLHEPTGRYLCEPCYKYIVKYKVDRPAIFWDTSRTWPCSNCGTEVSRRWVRDRETNELRCSPCNSYRESHKKANRPEMLWKPQQGSPFVPIGPRGPQKNKRSKVAPERPEGVEAS